MTRKLPPFHRTMNAIAVTLSEGVLTMQGITPDTLYFSDRPDRIVGRVSTREFVDHWSKGKDSFEANPPNAVLSTLQHKIPRTLLWNFGNRVWVDALLSMMLKFWIGRQKSRAGPALCLLTSLVRR